MVSQKDATTVLKSLSAYHTAIETSEDSETEYFIYSDISTRNDTKQRWQLNSCHTIPFYLPQLLTKSQKKERRLRSSFCSGDDLLSRAASRQVSSALQSLTTVFGMGTGVTSASLSPNIQANALISNLVFSSDFSAIATLKYSQMH